MDDSNKREFSQVLQDTFEVYDKQISSGKLRIYYETLKRYEIGDIKNAITAHLNNPESGQFVPKPADIVKYIDGGTETRSLEAWTKVHKSISAVGHYQSVVFDDPIIHAVIQEMGGWCKICEVLTKDVPFLAREFQKRYQGFSIKGGVREFPRMLVGFSDAHNIREGFGVQEPVLIGDSESATKVYELGSYKSGVSISRIGGLIKTDIKKIESDKDYEFGP